MSVVTKAELLSGVAVSPRRRQDAAALPAFLPYVDAVALEEDAAVHTRRSAATSNGAVR
ncbi:MAG: hypothetical protein AB7N65_14800 [Vicinamibacterales bacterium]